MGRRRGVTEKGASLSKKGKDLGKIVLQSSDLSMIAEKNSMEKGSEPRGKKSLRRIF